MSVVQIKGSGKSAVSDRSLFVGPTVPVEIKKIPKLIKKMTKSNFRQVVQVIVKEIEGSDIPDNVFSSVVDANLSEEDVAYIYSGLRKLLRLALRIPTASLKQETLIEDLHELKIPEEFIADIASVVYGSKRAVIDAKFAETRPQLPQLESFKWRVDVAISTSSLNRALQPVILIEMLDSSGKKCQFEMDIAKFHELRYNVSVILKQMEDLEKRSVLKIKEKT